MSKPPDLTPTMDALRVMATRADDHTPLVTVVGDLGRVLHRRPPEDTVVELLAGLAAVREQLDPALSRPYEHLHGAKSEEFLGGALWACADLLDAFRQCAEQERRHTRSRQGRGATREVILQLASRQPTVTPAEVRRELAAREMPVSPSTVSKAIEDLIHQEVLTPAEAPKGASRRHTFYRRVDSIGAEEDPLCETRALLRSLARRHGVDRVREAFQEVTEDVEAGLPTPARTPPGT